MYPKAKQWLPWYLNPGRASIMFPACKNFSDNDLKKIVSLKKDTTAQQIVGKDLRPMYLRLECM